MGEGYAFVAAGITFALVVAGSVWLGVMLDRRFGTGPLMVLVCALGGVTWAGYWLLQKVRAADRARRGGGAK